MHLLDRRRLRHLGREGDLLKRKLLIRPGDAVALVNWRPGYPVPEDTEQAPGEEVDVMLLFAESRAQLDASLSETGRLRPGGILWVAFPKGGARAGTDLGRDVLHAHMAAQGRTGVSLVALDERWSAMRFRPAAEP